MQTVCPYCQAKVASEVVLCPHCGGDLEPLAALLDLSADRFNDALRAAQSGNWKRAAGAIDSVLAMTPEDAEARLLAVKIHAWEGNRAAVEENLSAAANLTDNDEVGTLRAAAETRLRRIEAQRARRRKIRDRENTRA